MRDRDMVAAIVAGDPAGLAAAYDRHAADLYAYCRSLLTEPVAAEAVRDTFIIANATMARLRDRGLARAWLFAVARDVCHRRRHDASAAAWPARAGDVTGAHASPGAAASAGIGAGAGRPAARELMDCAIRSLNAAERDAAELCLRHDVSDAGLAATLGISRRRAHALVTRARKNLAASLGALLVARAGPQFCADLAPILAGWDGELTRVLRRELHTHIRRCAVCSERKRRKLQATMLLGLAAPAELPGEVWREILGLVTGTTPGGAEIAASAGPFGKSGFPAPPVPRTAAGRPARFVLTALAGATAFAAIGAGTVVVIGVPHRGGPAHRPGSALSVPTPKPATVLEAPPPSASHTRPAHRRPAPAASPVRATTAPAPPNPTASAPSAAPGTLSVWPATVTLTTSGHDGLPTGSFTVTANGGPVTLFTITIPADHVGDLTVAPSAGSLAAGQSIEVTVTLRGGHHARLHTWLGVQPGGLFVTVVYPPARD